MQISHILVLLVLLVMSLIAARFVIYFVFIGIIILGTELSYILDTLFKKEDLILKNENKITYAFSGIIALSSIIFFINCFNFSTPHFGRAVNRSVPEKAVDYIERNRFPGNIYNDFKFGGYISWRLYPWKKNFIDTRCINSIVLLEATWIYHAQESLNGTTGGVPLWESLLDNYNVHIILLDTLDLFGNIPPLLIKLSDSDNWVPVHVDSIGVVFLRKTKDNSATEKYRIPRETVYSAIIARAAKGYLKNNGNLNFLISIGDLYRKMGNMKDAAIAYDYVVNRLPKKSPRRTEIEAIRNEIAGKKVSPH